MNIDRSSVSRAVGRVQADPALKNMSNTLLDHLCPEERNNVPFFYAFF